MNLIEKYLGENKKIETLKMSKQDFKKWLKKEKITADTRPATGLWRNNIRVGSYFEMDNGTIEIDIDKTHF